MSNEGRFQYHPTLTPVEPRERAENSRPEQRYVSSGKSHLQVQARNRNEVSCKSVPQEKIMTNERIPSLLAVFTLLVTSTFIGTAQQTRTPRPPVQQEERQLPELASQEIDPEAFRGKVPKQCKGIRPHVQTHDANDNFNPPGNPVTLSPALAAYASGKLAKGYDDKRIDRWFFDSFKIRSCRVCYATLEVRVKHELEKQIGDDTGIGHGSDKTAALTSFYNDNIIVGGAPFSPPPLKVLSMDIWPPLNPNPPLTNPKVMTFALPVNALNNYLMSGSVPPTSLDIVVQDDTDVDYVTLSVWYY
jgi:hypothetical protein